MRVKNELAIKQYVGEYMHMYMRADTEQKVQKALQTAASSYLIKHFSLLVNS